MMIPPSELTLIINSFMSMWKSSRPTVILTLWGQFTDKASYKPGPERLCLARIFERASRWLQDWSSLLAKSSKNYWFIFIVFVNALRLYLTKFQFYWSFTRVFEPLKVLIKNSIQFFEKSFWGNFLLEVESLHYLVTQLYL